VAVTDGDGSLVGHGTAALTSHRTGRRHEQDPDQWWRALGAAFGPALRGLAAQRVRGLAICSTSGSFLLAGPDRRPRTPALMYDDGRATAEAADVAVAGESLWSSLGYAMQPSWALPRLVWLLRHDPALRADAAAGRLRLLHCADFLAGRLTGGPVATDWSHALKSGYDVDALRWPDTVLDRLGVPAALLPDVVRPGTPIGVVGAEGAAHTGLPQGVTVHAGLTDGCAAQVAAGALTPGSWNSVLGTTLVLKGVTERRIADPGGAMYSHRHPDGGWLPGGASSVGAGVLRARYPGRDLAALDALAERHRPSSGLIYPLAGRGERFPFVAPDARPFEVGVFADEGDRYAAVLQGVAFVERLSFAYLDLLGAPITGPVSITGGGSRSPHWSRLRADVLGRPLTLPRHPEPAFGMAVVAAGGAGPLRTAAEAMVRPGEVITPTRDGPGRLAPAYARFVAELADRGHLDPQLTRHALEQVTVVP
jgi:sugar (pentulose or hexulose) kinase